MNEKLYAVYHCTKYVPFKTFLAFVKNYQKYNANYKHKLIICFKNLSKIELKKFKKKLSKISYIEFIDNPKINDFDIGSYYRIAKKYKNSIFLFMNGHTYPVKKNWLSLMMKHYKSNRIVASSCSKQSLRDLPFNIRNNFLKNIYFRFILMLNFPKSPNPHLRSSGFLISSKNLLLYPFKEIKSKIDTNIIESGRKNMYNFYKNNKIKTLLVNSDGDVFEENDWHNSRTYPWQYQNKIIFSDQRIRKFKTHNKTI